MESKERIKLALNRKIPDRVPGFELSVWDETVERWRREGMPENLVYQSPFLTEYGKNVIDEYRMKDTFEDYFGQDRIGVVDFDSTMRFEEKVLEENEEFTIYRRRDGITNKSFKNRTVPPQQIDRIIKTRDDWENYKCRLKAEKSRIADGTIRLCRDMEAKGIFTVVKPDEPCFSAIFLLGEEEGLINIAAEPDFIEDFIAYNTEFQIEMLEIMLGEGVKPDALWYFSDLCYKNGMLFSPAFYRERVMKYHRRIFDFCRSRGMNIIYHCDGYVKQVLPLLIEAGIDCIQPMEVRAGNDVREYKQLYGDKIAFCGNISADILSTDKAAIEKEIREKMEAAKKGGGYIFHSDHSIPPSVSYENYCFAIETAEKLGNY